jgi:hypothetical protein
MASQRRKVCNITPNFSFGILTTSFLLQVAELSQTLESCAITEGAETLDQVEQN